MSEESPQQRVLAVYPGAVEMPDNSGAPSADYCIMRPATKEDWPENKWVQISPYVSGNPWKAAADLLPPLSEQPVSLVSDPQEWHNENWKMFRVYDSAGACEYTDRAAMLAAYAAHVTASKVAEIEKLRMLIEINGGQNANLMLDLASKDAEHKVEVEMYLGTVRTLEVDNKSKASEITRLRGEVEQRTAERDSAMLGQRKRQAQFEQMSNLADEAIALKEKAEAELQVAREALGKIISNFECDYVLDGVIVDDPLPMYVTAYQIAKAALERKD